MMSTWLLQMAMNGLSQSPSPTPVALSRLRCPALASPFLIVSERMAGAAEAGFGVESGGMGGVRESRAFGAIVIRSGSTHPIRRVIRFQAVSRPAGGDGPDPSARPGGRPAGPGSNGGPGNARASSERTPGLALRKSASNRRENRRDGSVKPTPGPIRRPRDRAFEAVRARPRLTP